MQNEIIMTIEVKDKAKATVNDSLSSIERCRAFIKVSVSSIFMSHNLLTTLNSTSSTEHLYVRSKYGER